MLVYVCAVTTLCVYVQEGEHLYTNPGPSYFRLTYSSFFLLSTHTLFVFSPMQARLQRAELRMKHGEFADAKTDYAVLVKIALYYYYFSHTHVPFSWFSFPHRSHLTERQQHK